MLDIFSQEILPPFSILNEKRFEIVYLNMSAFDWSMTHLCKTHATDRSLRNVTGGLYDAIHDVKMM
jgi:hypothetical protein